MWWKHVEPIQNREQYVGHGPLHRRMQNRTICWPKSTPSEASSMEMLATYKLTTASWADIKLTSEGEENE